MQLSRGVLSLLTVLLIFGVVGGVVTWRVLGAEEEQATGRDLPDTQGVQVASSEQFMGAQPVEGAEVIRDTLWIHVVTSGVAAANRQSVVASRSAGVVERVFVEENDFVSAGDILVQLDTLEAAIALAQARAQFTTAQAEYQERQLRGGDGSRLLTSLTPEEEAERERLIRIESGLQGAEFEVQRAEFEMDLTRIRAPFAGRIADLEAVEGAYVGSGAEVLTLVQIDPIRVQANVLERDILQVGAGRRATVRFTAIPNEAFEARVQSVNPLVDPEFRSGRVTLVMSNPNNRIRPGMYASVSVEGQAHPDRVLVPREAVVERGEDRRKVVFVAGNLNEQGEGITQWRYVTTGYSNDTHVEIVPGAETFMVEPGEIVLVGGHHYIAHDVPVRLVENAAAAGGVPGR